jgi:hypothetical protein
MLHALGAIVCLLKLFLELFDGLRQGCLSLRVDALELFLGFLEAIAVHLLIFLQGFDASCGFFELACLLIDLFLVLSALSLNTRSLRLLFLDALTQCLYLL